MSTTNNSNLFGPLEPLMNDPQVSEILVDGPARVYVRRRGKLADTDIQFQDGEALLAYIRQLAGLAGQTLDPARPLLDFRLSDGSRVNVVLPPLAPHGPVLTINKFQPDLLTIKELVAFGSISAEVAEFLQACVRARLNIVVSGGTASGKTTLLNVLASFIPAEERIIVVERTADLVLSQPRVVRLEALPPDREGQGAVTVRDLLANSLNMLPDRIIVGELEGGEVLELMQAMNTGYEGGLTLLHANNPRDALSRLEAMATLDNPAVPVLTVRKLMAEAIDLIVQQNRLVDGSRKVTHVTEVQGLQGDLPVLVDLFMFEQHGLENGRITGRLKPTGAQPAFLERLKAAGVSLPPQLFGLS